MENTSRVREILNQISYVGPDCWQQLEAKFYNKVIKEKEHFSKPNASTREIGFVISGIMRIYYLDDNGIEWNKKFLAKDDFVSANINPYEKSKVFIQALTKTEIIGIQFQELERLTKTYNELGVITQKLMMIYLDSKQNREIELLSMNAKERYLHFLEEYSHIKSDIPQYQIASYLGITPTQLSRLKRNL